ncbi:MAG: hypothetical protein ACREQV_21710, partial [Candidatus Binatia bacterium]
MQSGRSWRALIDQTDRFLSAVDLGQWRRFLGTNQLDADLDAKPAAQVRRDVPVVSEVVCNTTLS